MSRALTVPVLKLRNPLAIAARLRHAGTHQSRRSRTRQALRRELRSELKDWHAPPR